MSILHAHARACAVPAAFVLAPSACAHGTRQAKETPIDNGSKVVLRVPYGYKSSGATKIRIRVPAAPDDHSGSPASGLKLLSKR